MPVSLMRIGYNANDKYVSTVCIKGHSCAHIGYYAVSMTNVKITSADKRRDFF